MIRAARLWSAQAGNAAAEMALCLPLLLVLMFGSVELGNYLLDEHVLVKAVRDGARYAARQSFTAYNCIDGTVDADSVVTPTANLVRTGLTIGGADRLANWGSATFSVTVQCITQVANGTDSDGNTITEQMSGIYAGSTDGAPVVTVSASVPYQSILGSFGFTGIGMSLNASEQATVSGI